MNHYDTLNDRLNGYDFNTDFDNTRPGGLHLPAGTGPFLTSCFGHVSI